MARYSSFEQKLTWPRSYTEQVSSTVGLWMYFSFNIDITLCLWVVTTTASKFIAPNKIGSTLSCLCIAQVLKLPPPVLLPNLLLSSQVLLISGLISYVQFRSKPLDLELHTETQFSRWAICPFSHICFLASVKTQLSGASLGTNPLTFPTLVYGEKQTCRT